MNHQHFAFCFSGIKNKWVSAHDRENHRYFTKVHLMHSSRTMDYRQYHGLFYRTFHSMMGYIGISVNYCAIPIKSSRNSLIYIKETARNVQNFCNGKFFCHLVVGWFVIYFMDEMLLSLESGYPELISSRRITLVFLLLKNIQLMVAFKSL